MVYRYSWIAGIAAIGLAYWELTSLLRDSQTGTPWQVAILIATLLGAGITWTAIAYRAHALIVITVNLVAFVITAGILVAPDTLWTIFPTWATWDAIASEFGRAMDIIRYGVEPVRPVPGMVMLLAGLFWTLGFLLVAGLLNGRPFVAILTPLIVALQFVIIDRRPKSLGHLAVFVGVVAFALVAIRLDERDAGTGRLQRVNGTTKPTRRPSPAVVTMIVGTLVFSMTAVALAGDRVPSEGIVTWRQPAGFSDDYSGSVSYNPYTDIRAGLISQTNTPLFRAEISGADPSTVRFRTVTLDRYENGRWRTERIQAVPAEDEPWIDATQQYRGETDEVEAVIRIDKLAQPWMPAPTTPNAVIAEDRDDQATLRVRRLDASLYLPGDRTYEGMTYAVRAEVPRFDGPTVAALARTEEGRLSPLFTEAEEDGRVIGDLPSLPDALELPDEEFWLEYPRADLGARFVFLAEEVVGNVETNFEKALALEDWFRDSEEFTYDDDVPGAYTTADVYTWLTDDDGSLTDAAGFSWARHGYCEQFSTAMALMARAVGVPSRVVLGFTPGTQINDTTVQVMDKNAHAWVELWIPSYGWMAFDPTPRSRFSAPTVDETLEEQLGFSPADYIDDIPDLSLVDFEGDEGGLNPAIFQQGEERDSIFVPGGGSDEATSGFQAPAWTAPVLAVAALLAVLVAGIPLVKWFRRRRLARRLAAGDVAAAWEDIVDRLADLREPVDPAATPREAATAIDDAFVPLADTYDRALFGASIGTALVDDATDARLRAEQHLTTRYSTGERLRALYRPSRLITRLQRLRREFRLRR